MAYSAPSSSCAPRDFDVQLAARAGIQSLHSFISLFSATSSSSLQQLQSQSMAAAETINQFKHLGTLLSPHKGHARVRRAPRSIDAVNAQCADSPHTIRSPNLSPIQPNSSLGNPNFPSSASACFQFSQSGHESASKYGTDSCDSGGVDDDGQSVRGGSHIDLNRQLAHSDYLEGSVNKISRIGYYAEAINSIRDNCPVIDTDNNNNTKKLDNHEFSSVINGNNPPLFDLNQQAPSVDIFCPQPIFAFPLPMTSQESLSFDARAQSAAVAFSPAAPAASNNRSAMSSNGNDLAKFANNLSRRSTADEGSVTRQLSQIFSTNPQFEAYLEKASGSLRTPTHSHLSCITNLEGNPSTNGNLPPVQQPQSAMASMLDHKGASSAEGKRKCLSVSEDSKLTKCGTSPSKCHCAKRRKLKKKSIMRVPAVSDKVAEIPHDDHSWRKYGQKPIKGSPYPRGYYKCSGVKGCPAKKHVERALDDPSMLIITYEGEHMHSRLMSEVPLQI